MGKPPAGTHKCSPFFRLGTLIFLVSFIVTSYQSFGLESRINIIKYHSLHRISPQRLMGVIHVVMRICTRCQLPKEKFRPQHAICYDCVLEANRNRHQLRKQDPDYLAQRKKARQHNAEALAISQRRWREANKEHVQRTKKLYRISHRSHLNAIEAENRLQNKLKLITIFGGGCESCGYSAYHGALDFHHRMPQAKTFDISKKFGIREGRFQELVAEAHKCILLCSNCHRETHAGIRPLPTISPDRLKLVSAQLPH